MAKEIKNKSASVRDKLQNIARKEKIDFDSLLLRYFQERFIARLGNSRYSNRFILKGGLFLIYLDLPKPRLTKDIDFLVKQIKNNHGELESIFREILAIAIEDGVTFDLSSVVSERIREDADYEGVRIKFSANLGQARKILQIDLGFGDIIVPKASLMNLPAILEENQQPEIKVYSLESVIAEKFEAMIKLAMANSRMKDFYDIYMLSSNHNFNSEILQDAIESTLKHRNTILPSNPTIFQSEFGADESKKIQWNAFLRKSHMQNNKTEFSGIIKQTHNFLKPIADCIKQKTKLTKTWDCTSQRWQKHLN